MHIPCAIYLTCYVKMENGSITLKGQGKLFCFKIEVSLQNSVFSASAVLRHLQTCISLS